ncbi:MAG: hypothetical protein EBY18_01855 [Alphaproteobacteria bacterium]|nr:hypothetical protein [Alphaproteobacteria bacterium]
MPLFIKIMAALGTLAMSWCASCRTCMECDTTYPTRPTNFKLTHYPISPVQDGQVFVCHQARF